MTPEQGDLFSGFAPATVPANDDPAPAGSADFVRWYTERHGYEPFPWQAALAARVANHDWPEALTAPTGSGKTAVIDVWLWARLQGIAVPRRLVYVIDRRLVVDGVSAYANALVATLPAADRPSVTTMRGGLSIDDDWLLDPLRSGLIVSTVDQVGSRLLFSGYGVSPKAAPIHAGLLGNDCLLVLDEVHLAQPLLKTLASIQALRGDALPLPWRVLVMSATWDSPRVHGLSDADWSHPVLARRLGGAKPARLVKLRKDDDLAKALVGEARRLRAGGAGVVAVVCNRVARARAVFAALSAEGEAVLLTGRIRPFDKERLMAEVLPRTAVGTRGERAPLFVIATQTIEVGADLDLDALVSECAPLSALRQRAGRLNRIGALEQAPMAIVYQPAKDDPVYGDAIDASWKWLNRAATGRPKTVDFGIAAMTDLLAARPPPAEAAPEAPDLLAAHLDMLAMTSVPHGIDVSPWLHGWEAGAPDVYLCWRADWALDAVEVAPPVQHELLAIPVYALRQWNADVADLEGTEPRGSGRDRPHQLIRWDGETATAVDVRDLRPGDTLVLPTMAGGCDRFGWAPASREPVADVGDSARRVRLHPAVHPELADAIEALLADATTTLEQWRALARTAGLAEPGRALAYHRGCVVLARPEWTSHSAVRPIALAAHQRAVAERAEVLAAGSGLPEPIVAAERRAGAGHDTGKQDRRWQAMVGGDGDTLLAKGPGGDHPWLTLPRGWRHEMASAEHQREPLVRHLVGTHHGHGRPLFPNAPDPELWRRLDDWPRQYQALQGRFGHWGLAYLETLVRLADWSVSDEEQQ